MSQYSPTQFCGPNHLAMEMLVLSSLSPLLTLMYIPLKGFCSIGGHSGILCLRELAYLIMSDAIRKSKKNSKPTCNHAKAYGSTIHWHVFLALQMSVNVKNSSQKSPLEKWSRRIVVLTIVAGCFHGRK